MFMQINWNTNGKRSFCELIVKVEVPSKKQIFNYSPKLLFSFSSLFSLPKNLEVAADTRSNKSEST